MVAGEQVSTPASLLSEQLPLEMAGREALHLQVWVLASGGVLCDGLDISAELGLRVKLTWMWREVRRGCPSGGGSTERQGGSI